MPYLENMAEEAYCELIRLNCEDAVMIDYVGDFFILTECDGDRSAVCHNGYYFLETVLRNLPDDCGAEALWQAIDDEGCGGVLEDEPLGILIEDLVFCVENNEVEDAVRLTDLVISRGCRMFVAQGRGDHSSEVAERRTPTPRYLLADYHELATWTPAAENQATYDLACNDSQNTPNDAVAAVLDLVAQHHRALEYDSVDVTGAYAVYQEEIDLPWPVSFHSSEEIAVQEEERRNSLDKCSTYKHALREEVMHRREGWLAGMLIAPSQVTH